MCKKDLVINNIVHNVNAFVDKCQLFERFHKKVTLGKYLNKGFTDWLEISI